MGKKWTLEWRRVKIKVKGKWYKLPLAYLRKKRTREGGDDQQGPLLGEFQGNRKTNNLEEDYLNHSRDGMEGNLAGYENRISTEIENGSNQQYVSNSSYFTENNSRGEREGESKKIEMKFEPFEHGLFEEEDHVAEIKYRELISEDLEQDKINDDGLRKKEYTSTGFENCTKSVNAQGQVNQAEGKANHLDEEDSLSEQEMISIKSEASNFKEDSLSYGSLGIARNSAGYKNEMVSGRIKQYSSNGKYFTEGGGEMEVEREKKSNIKKKEGQIDNAGINGDSMELENSAQLGMRFELLKHGLFMEADPTLERRGRESIREEFEKDQITYDSLRIKGNTSIGFENCKKPVIAHRQVNQTEGKDNHLVKEDSLCEKEMMIIESKTNKEDSLNYGCLGITGSPAGYENRITHVLESGPIKQFTSSCKHFTEPEDEMEVENEKKLKVMKKEDQIDNARTNGESTELENSIKLEMRFELFKHGLFMEEDPTSGRKGSETIDKELEEEQISHVSHQTKGHTTIGIENSMKHFVIQGQVNQGVHEDNSSLEEDSIYDKNAISIESKPLNLEEDPLNYSSHGMEGNLSGYENGISPEMRCSEGEIEKISSDEESFKAPGNDQEVPEHNEVSQFAEEELNVVDETEDTQSILANFLKSNKMSKKAHSPEIVSANEKKAVEEEDEDGVTLMDKTTGASPKGKDKTETSSNSLKSPSSISNTKEGEKSILKSGHQKNNARYKKKQRTKNNLNRRQSGSQPNLGNTDNGLEITPGEHPLSGTKSKSQSMPELGRKPHLQQFLAQLKDHSLTRKYSDIQTSGALR